jgi:exopolyphosphatase/guanosine-5'-triphosphate,3'-diphosphate pyrophosphatase
MILVSRRISAIDIGSNAIRMMIAEVSPQPPYLHVIKKFRAAVRLGHDVFTTGTISPHSFETAQATFHQFAETNKHFEVSEVRAVATSATREAKNKDQFVKEIHKTSGIKIEVIDGIEEGRLIHLAVRKELDLDHKKTMLIDIGGGSVEITFSKGPKMLATKSFPMGTVRVLENLTKRKLNENHLNIIMGEFMSELGSHIYSNSDHDPVDFAIGTGGNLECLGELKVQLLKKNPNTFLTFNELDEIITKLRSLSYKERVEKLKLRPDRADVIMPAAMLVQTILRQSETAKIVIPRVGLRDGLIWSMADKK